MEHDGARWSPLLFFSARFVLIKAMIFEETELNYVIRRVVDCVISQVGFLVVFRIDSQLFSNIPRVEDAAYWFLAHGRRKSNKFDTE